MPFVNQDITSSFFEGVSGGGLWQADVKRDTNGEYSLCQKPRLEGVAFYRTDPVNDAIHIRFHGRRSIYKHALAVLRAELAKQLVNPKTL